MIELGEELRRLIAFLAFFGAVVRRHYRLRRQFNSVDRE